MNHDPRFDIPPHQWRPGTPAGWGYWALALLLIGGFVWLVASLGGFSECGVGPNAGQCMSDLQEQRQEQGR